MSGICKIMSAQSLRKIMLRICKILEISKIDFSMEFHILEISTYCDFTEKSKHFQKNNGNIKIFGKNMGKSKFPECGKIKIFEIFKKCKKSKFSKFPEILHYVETSKFWKFPECGKSKFPECGKIKILEIFRMWKKSKFSKFPECGNIKIFEISRM